MIRADPTIATGITLAPAGARKPGDPWQSADGRWWTPGALTEDGNIVSDEPGYFLSAGVVYIAEDRLPEAQRHGWQPSGVGPRVTGLAQVQR